jgi:tetratricopeptide (TPR) repeat protein
MKVFTRPALHRVRTPGFLLLFAALALLALLYFLATTFRPALWNTGVTLVAAAKIALHFWQLHKKAFSDTKDLFLYLFLFPFVIALFFGFVVFLYREVKRQPLIIDPFIVPAQIGNLGLTGDVFASRIKDRLHELARMARIRSSELEDDFVLPKEAGLSLDLEIPGTKVGLKTIVEIVRALFNKYPIRISGDVVLPAASSLTATGDASIAIRITRNNRSREPLRVASPPDSVDAIVHDTAEAILRHINPFQLGAYYRQSGNEGAAESIWQAIADDPSHQARRRALAIGSLGFLLQRRGKPEEAIALFQKAIALHPAYPPFYNNWGNALRDQKKHEDSIAKYRKAIELDSRFAFPQANWGNVLRDQGNFAEAALKFQKAIDLDPQFSGAYSAWGYSLQRQEKLEDAIAKYQKAIELDPKNAAALNNWGNILREQQKPDDAIAKYRLAIDADPAYASPHRNWGDVLRDQENFEEAALKFQKATELDPKFADAYHGWGYSLQRQGKPEDAIAKYRKSVDLDPKNAAALNNWGNILREQQKPDDAIAKYRLAIDADPAYAAPHNNWGNALRDQGKFEEAAARYHKAVDLDPTYAWAYNNWGYALEMQGQLDEAVSKYQEALDLDPGIKSARDSLDKLLQQRALTMQPAP